MPIALQQVVHEGSRPCQGFSLVEVMLAMAVFSGVMLLAVRFMNEYAAQQEGVERAEALASFQSLAANYVTRHRDEILQAVKATAANDPAVQTHCVTMIPNPTAPVDPGVSPGRPGNNGTLAWSARQHTCAFDASRLQASGVWPASSITYNDPETGGAWRYAIIIKQVIQPGPDGVSGTADDVPTDNLEALVVRADEDGTLNVDANTWRGDERRRNVVQAAIDRLGQLGGYTPVGDAGFCKAVKGGAVEVCGKGWKVDLSRFLDTAALNRVKAALPTN